MNRQKTIDRLLTMARAADTRTHVYLDVVVPSDTTADALDDEAPCGEVIHVEAHPTGHVVTLKVHSHEIRAWCAEALHALGEDHRAEFRPPHH